MPLKSGGAVENEKMRGRSNSGLISIGKAVVPPPPYTPEFYDGFDKGDFSKWSEAVAVQVITSPVHHGTYAARSTNDATAHLRHIFSAGVPTYIIRFFGYFSVMTGTGGQVLLGVLSDGTLICELYLSWDGAKWVLALFDYEGGWTEGPTSITAGWHCIIIEANKGTGAVMNVWLDGALEISKTVNNPDTDLTSFYLYPYYPTTTPKMDVDCVIGDTTNPTCAYYPHLGV